MNIQKLRSAMDNLKRNVGEDLVVSTIIGYSDGQTILSHNSDPKTDALVAKMSQFCVQVFEKAGIPGIEVDDYFIIDMENNMMTVVILFDKYCWAIGVNKVGVPVGMLLNVILPDAMEEFKAAL